MTTVPARKITMSGGGPPPGSMLPYGGATAPTGYLLCDGTSYLRADYADLFAAIGTLWGSADGTHFNVPDMRERVPVGRKASDTDFGTVGQTGGARTQTPSSHSGTAIADHASHTHSVTSNVTVGNHTFTQPTISWPAGVPTATGAAVADHASHTHSVTSNVTVTDHASHTHTYTGVPDHVHAFGTIAGTIPAKGSAGSTGGGASLQGATGIPVTVPVTVTGSTANPTGGVGGTGTTAGPNATLTHAVTNNAVTSGNPSATLTHGVTQPTIAWPAGVPTNAGGSVDAHAVTNNAVTSAGPSATLSHSVTQPNDHSAMSVVQQYGTVNYIIKI